MFTGHFVAPAARSALWHWASCATLLSVGLMSKGFLAAGVNSKVDGLTTLVNQLRDARRARPVITVANHASSLDDPLLWGFLPTTMLVQSRGIRWSLGAKEICHKNIVLDQFFQLGKTLPIVRGDGIYQPAINFALDRLNDGEWVHVFPEARINQDPNMIRFKWGVARLIMECRQSPIVIPIWHHGMADIMPLKSKIPLPRLNKSLVMTVGQPIPLDDLYAASRSLVTKEYNTTPNVHATSIYDIYCDEPPAVVDMRVRIVQRLYNALYTLQQAYHQSH
ncbi:acyltransferase-domain-containing protein [Syncephalis plumigaleata]|nr:acyltransferase-domain-containing protein [Syncephalis plumigaleata]